MRTPRRALLALAAMTGAMLALIIPNAAFAAYYGSETDYAVDSSYTGYFPGPICSDYMGRACFQPSGDLFYVEDYSADGYVVVAEWKTSTGRSGSCIDNLTAAKDWTVCNKDFPETSTVTWRVAAYKNGSPAGIYGPWKGMPASG